MRRIHLPNLAPGQVSLPPLQAHHARDVLRLRENDPIEVFDSAGQTARAAILRCTPDHVLIEIGPIQPPPANNFTWTVASAIPKGPRADWMIEKLSELGTDTFIPLKTARGVVVPEGQGKFDRWNRIAAESAKQSRRSGVMRIADLIDLRHLLPTLAAPAWYLSTDPLALPAPTAAQRLLVAPSATPISLTLFIGPEGGWTPDELTTLQNAHLTSVSLGATILRIETAAVTAAAIAAAILAPSFTGKIS